MGSFGATAVSEPQATAFHRCLKISCDDLHLLQAHHGSHLYRMAPKEGAGKAAGNAGGGKAIGKGSAVRWACNLCSSRREKVFNWGQFCCSCGKPKNQCLANPREVNGVGRPPQQPTNAEPSYRDATKGKGKGKQKSELATINERLDKFQQMFEKSQSDGQAGLQPQPTVVEVAKPVPGKELFVDFDGKPTSLD